MIRLLFSISLLFTVAFSCSTGFYEDIDTTCLPCHASCEECAGPNANECSSCFSDMTFSANTCNCPVSTFFNSATKSCQSCHSSCATCDGPASTDCLSCDLPSKYYYGKCITCPFNSYVNSTGSCKACDISCYDCSDFSATSCTACRNNMALVSGQCVCPDGYFLHTTTYTCLPCYAGCETCSGPLQSQCLSCPSGLTLYKTACLCPSRSYFDTTASSCIACDNSCSECFGPASNQCKSCDDGKYLRSYSCPTCHASCLTCSGPSSRDCVSCPEGKVLFNGQCVTQNTGCHETCTQCIGPNADQCIFCKSPLLFIQGSLAGTCSETCPSTTYMSTENGRAECKKKIELRGSLSLSDLNEYKITFNTDISSYYTSLLESMTIEILLQPKQAPVTYTKEFSFDSNNKKGIFISFKWNGDMLPNNILMIQFSNSDTSENCKYYMKDNILRIELQEYTKYSAAIEKMISAVSTINTAGSQANGAFSFSSAFILKSIHSLRSHVMETMIGYLVFLNVYYPPNFIKYATDMTNNDDDFSPNFFTGTAEAMEAEVQQQKVIQNPVSSSESGRLLSDAVFPYNDRYNGLVPSQLFISNLGAELTMFIIALICLVVVEAVVKLMPAKYQKTKIYGIIVDCSRSFRWNFILNQVLSSYHDFTMYAFMDVINITDFRAAYGVYFLMAPCALILSVSGPFIFYFFMRWFFAKLAEYKHASKKEEHPSHDMIKRFKLTIKPFKKNRMSFLMYHLILMIRSFIFAVVVVFAQNSPDFQVIINPLMSFGVLFYLLKWRPFKIRAQLFLSVVYELIYLIAAFTVLTLHFYTKDHMEDVSSRGNMAFVIIACSMSMMALDFISIFFEISDMIREYKKKKKQSNKVAPLKNMTTTPIPLQSPSSQPMLSFHHNNTQGTLGPSINNEKLLGDDPNDTQNDLSPFNNRSIASIRPKSPLENSAKISPVKERHNSTFKSYVLNSLTLPGVGRSRKSSIWPEKDLVLSSTPMSPAESDHELSQHNFPSASVIDKRSQFSIEKDEGTS